MIYIAKCLRLYETLCSNCRFGYNTWRDPIQPTAILEKLCKEAGFAEPHYLPGHVVVADQPFYEQELVENEQGSLVIHYIFVACSAY